MVDIDNVLYIARSVLSLETDYIYNSSLRFIFSQLDIHRKIHEEANKKSKGKSNSRNSNERKEDTKSYQVLD